MATLRECWYTYSLFLESVFRDLSNSTYSSAVLGVPVLKRSKDNTLPWLAFSACGISPKNHSGLLALDAVKT